MGSGFLTQEARARLDFNTLPSGPWTVVLTLNGNSFSYTAGSVAALITAISNGTDDGTNDPGDENFVASTPGTGILVIETVDAFGNKPGAPFAVSVKNVSGSLEISEPRSYVKSACTIRSSSRRISTRRSGMRIQIRTSTLTA
jgi:hypothetical protein